MTKRTWLALVSLFAVLSLVGAACASDSGETGGGGGGAADVCAADEFGCVEIAAGDPITVGTLQAISGDVATLGQDQVNGVQLAVDYLDGALDGTNGQLLGHDVVVTGEDDGCSAEGGQAGATALAANDQIVGVIGSSCSSAALGVADTILGDKGILLISGSNTNPGLTSEERHQPFYFRTAHNDKIQGAIVSDFALQELGAQTAATINDESPYADGLAAAFRDNFEAGGGTITAIEAINSADVDFKSLLEGIKAKGADVLYFPDFNPACALIAQQAKEILPDTALIGSDGCLATTFLETAGAAADGVYASSPDLGAFQSNSFYANDFLNAYQAAFGSAPTSVFHAHAFDATNILFEAIKSVAIENEDGSLSIPRTALRDALAATSGWAGLTGTITCTPLGDCATDVTIGIFKAPGWPVEGGSGDQAAVFSETKSLADVV